MAVSALAWVAPRTAARTFGIDPDRSNGVVSRLFGARDLLLGTAPLVADDKLPVPAARIGATIDALDVVATGIEYRGGRVSTWSALGVGGGAALFLALGLLVIRDGEEARAPGTTTWSEPPSRFSLGEAAAMTEKRRVGDPACQRSIQRVLVPPS